MKADIQNDNGIVLVKIHENFDIVSLSNLKTELFNFTQDTYKKVILDLSNVKFLDSTAIGIIVKTALQAQENSVKLAVVNLDENIYKLFTMSNLHRIVSIFENMNKAVDYVNQA